MIALMAKPLLNKTFPGGVLPGKTGAAAGAGDQPASKTLTRTAFEKLTAELDDLTTRGRIEIARAIEAARALGDLSENGDYHAAKDAQGKMESRIRRIQATLEGAAIVADEEAARSETVTTGSVVIVIYEGDDQPESLIVGTLEEERDGLSSVSPSSPLGQALMGRKAGDTVEYEAPSGMLRVTVSRVGGDT